MKLSLRNSLATAAAAVTLLFASLAFARGPNARSLHEVDSIWLDADVCLSGLSNETHRRGFAETRSPRSADAVLEVNVHPLDAHIGASARYSAVLIGDNDRVLFSTSGSENSISQRELCADISDDIFDRMESRRG